MHLIVGLGNPGRSYARNRHNVGFLAVEAIARAQGFGPFKKAFQGLWSEGRMAGERVGLLLPQTYMNESGRAVGEALRFHKLTAQDVAVLHDELDLPLGKMRVKTGGGDAGHNGLRSITAHIGGAYRRIRLGIGHPGDKALVHGHVLGDFSKAEGAAVEALCEALAKHADLIVRGDDAGLQNKVHLETAAAGPAGGPREANRG